MEKEAPGEFHPKSRKHWREWLQKNAAKVERISVVINKKDSSIPGVKYEEAVEEGLCFGWIDGRANSKDKNTYLQLFTKRKANSGWSESNKIRVERLISEKLMTKAGMEVIELAKKTGTWNKLDDMNSLKLPAELVKALSKNKTASKYFEAFPPSAKKIIIAWIGNAKRDETRTKRIEQTVSLAAKNIRANQ